MVQARNFPSSALTSRGGKVVPLQYQPEKQDLSRRSFYHLQSPPKPAVEEVHEKKGRLTHQDPHCYCKSSSFGPRGHEARKEQVWPQYIQTPALILRKISAGARRAQLSCIGFSSGECEGWTRTGRWRMVGSFPSTLMQPTI